MTLERPCLPMPRGAEIVRGFSVQHAVNALVAFIFAASGPVAIILAVGTKGGLGEADLASWIFGAFFLNGLISIGFCLAYRQPLVFFWTIPGTVLVGPTLAHATFPEVVGAFVATGVLMLMLGVSGLIRRAMAAVPLPIVMGMVAGVFLQFGLDWVAAFKQDLAIAAAMTAAFLALSAVPALARKVPPLIAALVVGFALAHATGAFRPEVDLATVLAAPRLYAPQFSWPVLIELVVPLTITVLVVQNGQGIAALSAAGHRPPINAIAAACGIGSIAAAGVGTVSTCLTGPVNAILASGGERATQYTAGVFVGLLALAFGLFAPLFTRLLLAAPPALIATLAGLAMLRVLQSAFAMAFQGRFTLGALITFIVTVAGLPILNIGAPFWGLVFGVLASIVLERHDFRASRA